jgi:hypothetical protein
VTQDRSRRVRKVLLLPGFDPRSVDPVPTCHKHYGGKKKVLTEFIFKIRRLGDLTQGSIVNCWVINQHRSFY